MTYVIKRGKHYSFNLRRFIPFFWSKFKRKKLVFSVTIYNLYATLGDSDLRGDWSKLFGVNLTAFKASDQNSIMIGFRSTDEVYEYTLYRNSNEDRIIPPGDPITEEAGVAMEGEIEYLGVSKYRVKFQGKEWTFVEHNRSWLCRLIFTWFGGKDDGNDGLGGTAPEDIRFELEYKWVKK